MRRRARTIARSTEARSSAIQPLLVDVGAVDGKTGDHLGDRIAQAVEREIARAPVALADAVEHVGQDIQLAGHRGVHDQPLGVVEEIVEGAGLAGRPAVDLAHAPGVGVGDEHPVYLIEEVVAGGAVDRPVRGQPFAARQDLFGDDVERSRPGSAGYAPGVGRQVLQHLEIPGRVEQAIRMIDADAAHQTVAQKRRQQLVNRAEHLRIFDPQPGQGVDVEEPAIVDFLRGGPPVCQPVGLLLEQLVQRIEGPRLSRRPVVAGQDSVALRAGARGGVDQPRLMANIHRQLVIEVLQQHLAVPHDELQFAALEDLAVLIAQDRQQQFAAQLAFDRVPVDVEEGRRPRLAAVREDVAPPRIGLRCRCPCDWARSRRCAEGRRPGPLR